MTHMGLFEGIGGFSLAARWAGWQTPVMVEWNTYCQAVLKKNFPYASIFGDIRKFNYASWKSVLRNRGIRDRQIDIITGGFPCQPFSHAGKRNGTDDDRYLWPEMYRIIREVAPAWVIGENVAGLLSMDGGRVFAGILADLENAGYNTETYLIPALAVGAPHRRDRVWIVAHRDHIERDRRGGTWSGRAEFANENSRATSDADHDSTARQRQYSRGVLPIAEPTRFISSDFVTADADEQRLEKRKSQPGNNGQERQATIGNFWGKHWYEVATGICGMDDGFSAGVDGITEIPAKKNTGKAHRLEAIGNAIVPQIAYQIFDAINQHKP